MDGIVFSITYVSNMRPPKLEITNLYQRVSGI